MHILLAAATTFEIQPTIDFLLNPDSGPLTPSHRCPVLITGIGGLATTWSLMRQIGRDRPDLIIQAGVAGCFTERQLGEVVLVDEEILADLGVWEDQQFKTLFDLRLADANTQPFSNGRLINPYRQLLTLRPLQTAKSITVNEITTRPDRIRWYQQNTDAVVESMEGGALHYVCLQENIAFLQLRSVSNAIGVRDKTKWNMPLAIDRLNEELIQLLQQLKTKDKSVLEPINQ
jgi:futalosine hydrolase